MKKVDTNTARFKVVEKYTRVVLVSGTLDFLKKWIKENTHTQMIDYGSFIMTAVVDADNEEIMIIAE